MDHNLDLIKHAQHESTEVFINSMLENSSFPCITQPTRVTQTSSTLIDNIFVNGRLHTNTRSCVLLHDISDHFPCLTMIRDMYAKKCVDKTIYSHDITDSRIECLKTDLSTIDWERLLPTENPSLCYDTFISKLEDLLEKNMPICEKVITYHQHACEPWLTQSLLNCGKKQLKLYSRAIKSGNDDDLTCYKKYKSVLQRIKRHCKIDYYHDKCAKFKNNTKKLWKIINSATKGLNDKSSVIDSINVNNIEITEGKQIAEEFAKYFASIGM